MARPAYYDRHHGPHTPRQRLTMLLILVSVAAICLIATILH